MENRKFKTFQAKRQAEGRGATVQRVFPSPHLSHLDPFVLLDEFFAEAPHGFPEHPHRGFEAVTYILEGTLRHTDSSGVKELLHQGDTQVVTTGKGIEHSEMPEEGERCHGLQLWVNLPQRLKDLPPSYDITKKAQLPVLKEENQRITTIIGKNSPVEVKAPVKYLFAELEGTSFKWTVQENWNGFLYVVNGEVKTEGKTLAESEVLVKDFKRATILDITASDNATFIATSGKPHEEIIKQHGPFVD